MIVSNSPTLISKNEIVISDVSDEDLFLNDLKLI